MRVRFSFLFLCLLLTLSVLSVPVSVHMAASDDGGDEKKQPFKEEVTSHAAGAQYQVDPRILLPDFKELTPQEKLEWQMDQLNTDIVMAQATLNVGGKYVGLEGRELAAYMLSLIGERQSLGKLRERLATAADLRLAAAVPSTDDSPVHADALFKVFDGSNFLKQLDVPRLRKLLKQPPVSPVPAPRHSMAILESLWPSTVHPDRPLFVTAKGTENPRRLLLQLEYALTVEPPMGTPTELLYTAFWYNIGWSLPELAGRMLCFDAILNRAPIDTSITNKDAKADYMVLLDGVLCIGGEDKVPISQYSRAVNECGEKHKGASAAMYGRLGYILLVVVAGNKFGVHAMTLEPKSSPQMLVEFQMGTSQGRRDAILTFINITRWLRTVHELSLLPPRPMLTLLKAVTRPSPYTLGDVMMSDTEITMTFRFVSKTVWVPTTYIYVMLKVYGMLNAGIGGALHCNNMKINRSRIELEHPMQQVSLTDNTFHKVELELTPVGAGWYLENEAALWHLCHDVLTALSAVHEEGFVHRDVRSANILYDTSGYFLIDWEVAGCIGDRVFWHAVPDYNHTCLQAFKSERPGCRGWTCGSSAM
eukprot:TRINITY_DN5017_c0_g1_i1.p1 TRINITY_DN5017_c0_g1~~TRINITY_DN5017_c0_g1_i1.p1  ORF type:complete len:591 (+),score=71.53 TRINITY_DN5017_c0_g1_i1:38-1810(+)